jgi:hypothetical protein
MEAILAWDARKGQGISHGSPSVRSLHRDELVRVRAPMICDSQIGAGDFVERWLVRGIPTILITRPLSPEALSPGLAVDVESP